MNNQNDRSPLPHVLQFKLWSKVKIAGENPDNNFYTNCWEFQGTTNDFGHGRFSHRGKSYLAHRVAYCTAHGIDISTFPSDTVVRHKCDNPRCCNALHLETGSQADNQLDMEIRGRNPKGDSHGMASIDSQTALQIKYLFSAAKGVTGARRAISKRLGVSYKVVADIIADKAWTCVDSDFNKLTTIPTQLTAEELIVPERENNHGGSTLTPIDVQKIRALRQCGETFKSIGEKFGGIAESSVHNIVSKKHWSEVPDASPETVLTPDEIATAKARKENIGEDHHSAVLSNLQVREIRWLYREQGELHGFISKIAERYLVSKQVARDVAIGLTYKTIQNNFEQLDPKPPLVTFEFVTEHGCANLKAQQIREIRWLANQHNFHGVNARLAERYNTTKMNVSSIVARKTWANLPDDFDTLVKPEPLEAPASANSKLTVTQVLEIHYLWDTSSKGKGVKLAIADRYGMEQQAIYSILNGTTWGHIVKDYTKLEVKPEPIGVINCRQGAESNAKLNATQVREIRYLHATVEKKYGLVPKLAAQYEVSPSLINQITRRESWSHIPDDFDTLTPKPSLAPLRQTLQPR